MYIFILVVQSIILTKKSRSFGTKCEKHTETLVVALSIKNCIGGIFNLTKNTDY